jgi:hypothetical protein
MGTPKRPEKALLFIGTLYSNKDYYYKSIKLLEKSFGEIIMEGPEVNWNFSEYYKKEIGSPLFRRFLFFKNFIEQEKIVDIKLKTNETEQVFSQNNRRNINLDPGYLTLSKIVLASTKDYSHRIYLGRGIYGEVTLIYNSKKKTFEPHINTYRDYRDERYIRLFLIARKFYQSVINMDK